MTNLSLIKQWGRPTAVVRPQGNALTIYLNCLNVKLTIYKSSVKADFVLWDCHTPPTAPFAMTTKTS
ncbi:MAG: hypothetical protein ACI4MS_02095 [Candidatus Coproplasma sp.]